MAEGSSKRSSRQQEEEEMEREAEEFRKQLPRGFHEVLVNVARSVILHQPKDPLLYCAQFLEAEIDRRVLYDLVNCESPTLIASSAIAQAVQQVQPASTPIPTQSPHPPIIDTDEAKRSQSPGLFSPVHPEVTSYAQVSSPRGRDLNVGDVPLLVAPSPGHTPSSSQHLIYPTASARCVSQQPLPTRAASPQQQQLIRAPSPVAASKSTTSVRIATVSPIPKPADEHHQQQQQQQHGDGAHVQDVVSKPVDDSQVQHTVPSPPSHHDVVQPQQQQPMAAHEPTPLHSPTNEQAQHQSPKQEPIPHTSPAHDPATTQKTEPPEYQAIHSPPDQPAESASARRKSKRSSKGSVKSPLCCCVDVMPQEPPAEPSAAPSKEPTPQPKDCETVPQTSSAESQLKQEEGGLEEPPPSQVAVVLPTAPEPSKAMVRLDQTMEISSVPNNATGNTETDNEVVVAVDYKVTAVYDTHTGEVQTTAMVTSDEQPNDMGRVQLSSAMQATVSLSKSPLFDVSSSHPSTVRPVYETSSSYPLNHVQPSPEGGQDQGHRPHSGKKTDTELHFDGYLHTGTFQPAGPSASEPQWKKATACGSDPGQGQGQGQDHADECSVPTTTICGFATPLTNADSNLHVSPQQQHQQQTQSSGHSYCPFSAATLHRTPSQKKQLAGDADALVQSAIYAEVEEVLPATTSPATGLRPTSISRAVIEEYERSLMREPRDHVVSTQVVTSAPASNHGLQLRRSNSPAPSKDLSNKPCAPSSSSQQQQQPTDGGAAKQAHSLLLDVSSSNPNAVKSPFEISSSYPVNYVPPSPETHTGKTLTEVRFEGYLHTGTFQPAAYPPKKEPTWNAATPKQSLMGLPASAAVANTVCGFASPSAAASNAEMIADRQQSQPHVPIINDQVPFCPFTAASLQTTSSQTGQLAGDADPLVKATEEATATDTAADTGPRREPPLRQSSISRAVNEEYERALQRETREQVKTPRPHPLSISRTANEEYERHLMRDEAAHLHHAAAHADHQPDLAASPHHPEHATTTTFATSTAALAASPHPEPTTTRPPSCTAIATFTQPTSAAVTVSPDTDAVANPDTTPLVYGHYGNQWPRITEAISPLPDNNVNAITVYPTGITPMTFGHYSAFASAISFC